MLSSETISKYLEVDLTLAHVGAFLNDHLTFDLDIARSFLLECDTLVDAV